MTGAALSEFDRALGEDRVLAILRYRSGGPVVDAVDAIRDGGVRVVEVTTSTPGWLDAISAAADRGHLVGAGTVLTSAQVRDTAAAGGRFVVSPGLDEDVVAACRSAGIEPLPGVATATEVARAVRLGARWLKLFPAGALGIDYLKQLRGPFAELSFVPTGGITTASIPEWLAAGAAALALGSELAGRDAPMGPQQLQALRTRAGAAIAAARGTPE